jgi:hypothetical protein
VYCRGKSSAQWQWRLQGQLTPQLPYHDAVARGWASQHTMPVVPGFHCTGTVEEEEVMVHFVDGASLFLLFASAVAAAIKRLRQLLQQMARQAPHKAT